MKLVISFFQLERASFASKKVLHINRIKEHAFVVVSEISNYYFLYRVSMNNAAILYCMLEHIY